MPPPGYKMMSVREESHQGLMRFAGQVQAATGEFCSMSNALQILLNAMSWEDDAELVQYWENR